MMTDDMKKEATHKRTILEYSQVPPSGKVDKDEPVEAAIASLVKYFTRHMSRGVPGTFNRNARDSHPLFLFILLVEARVIFIGSRSTRRYAPVPD